MHLQILFLRLKFFFTVTCLALLYQLAIATLPGASTDFLLPKSGPGRLRDTDTMSISSSVNFHPSLITCTYHGIWGCPIWRVRITFPPPDLGFDSVAGSTIDLPLRPCGIRPQQYFWLSATPRLDRTRSLLTRSGYRRGSSRSCARLVVLARTGTPMSASSRQRTDLMGAREWSFGSPMPGCWRTPFSRPRAAWRMHWKECLEVEKGQAYVA